MKVVFSFIFLTVFIFASCKKANERGCLKSTGKLASIEFELDSVQEFRLFKEIVYEFYQDTLRKAIIKGGVNVIEHIEIENVDYVTSINNHNSCKFLRDYDDKITVEIHYPHFASIYAESSENMRFMDTLTGDQTIIELRNGGGNLELNVNVNKLYLDVSFGAGSITVFGETDFLKLSTQNMGRINALGIKSNDMFIYQSSITDMPVNVDNSNVKVHFSGNGDVRYIGVPSSLEITGEGDGEVVTY